MKKGRIIAILVAILASSLFLYLVMSPPSVFNLLPLAIHQAFFLDITESGISSSVEESVFIKTFDAIVAIFIFIFIYFFSSKILKR